MAGFDLTAKNKAELTKKHADELKAKQKSVALAAEKLGDEGEEPIEVVSREDVPVIQVDGDVEITAVDVTERIMTFKVNTDLESVTIGYGNTYDFSIGQTYKAPESIYRYLDHLGFIWH